MNTPASITVTPVFVADLHVEGERMPIYVHVIDHPEARVLVDTGMTELHPLLADMEPRLRPLSEQDFDLASIDVVVNTHLHGDHCGWNTTVSEGRATPTFPNARYIAQRDEYAAARYPNERTRATYFLDNYLPLEEARVLDLVDGDVRVTEHIRTVVTPGHTLRHQCVIIAPPGAAPIVFLADLAPRAVHLERTAWVPAVDVYPLDSLVTKRTMARWIVEHDAVCVFEHDDVTPVGRLEPDGERYRVVPVESVTSR